jgi:RNA polymerase sigma-70 factor (ECF subfamily)
LYRIASNECLLYFRKKKYLPGSLDKLISAKFWDAVDPATALEEKLYIERELQQHKEFIAVRQEIMKLPVPYQEVLTLRYFEEKNIKDIAMILNKKEGTVKSLLSRGIEKLRKVL